MPDFFNTAAGAASIMGFILAVILGAVSWRISHLIASGTAETKAMLERMDERTTRMNELAEARHREVLQRLPEGRP